MIEFINGVALLEQQSKEIVEKKQKEAEKIARERAEANKSLEQKEKEMLARQLVENVFAEIKYAVQEFDATNVRNEVDLPADLHESVLNALLGSVNLRKSVCFVVVCQGTNRHNVRCKTRVKLAEKMILYEVYCAGCLADHKICPGCYNQEKNCDC